MTTPHDPLPIAPAGVTVRRQQKCDHCPLGEHDAICLGQLNLRICQRHDPSRAAEFATPPAGPGLVRMAANFAGAVVQHAEAGFPKASAEVQAERLATCRRNACGFYDGGGDRCLHGSCGCYLPWKVSFADQSCPLDPPLWGPVPPEDERSG